MKSTVRNGLWAVLGALLGIAWPGLGGAQVPTPTMTPWPNPCTLDNAWGGVGSGDGLFNSPRAFAIQGDTIYVADLGNNRIQRFTLDGSLVLPHLTLGGTLIQPFGLTLDGAGMLYVTEDGSGTTRVLKVDPATDQAAATIQSGTDAYGGISVDTGGDVYVAVTSQPVTLAGNVVSESVRKFHETSPNVWTLATTLIGASWANDVLAQGNGVTLYIADTGGNEIQRYLEVPPGSNQYVFDRNVVTGGNIPGTTTWPAQMRVDSRGYFYLTDLSRRFQVFDDQWNFRYQCQYPSQNSGTYGLAVDGSANVYLGTSGVWKFHAAVIPPLTPPLGPTPTQVPCNGQNETAYLYPSPLRGGTGHFGVVLCKAGPVKVAIYNALGDLAGKADFAGIAGDNRFDYDFSNFARGVYYYLVETDGIRQKPGKFAVTR